MQTGLSLFMSNLVGVRLLKYLNYHLIKLNVLMVKFVNGP